MQKTILVIEDDKDIQEALAYALKLEGYDVLTASHGKDGLAVLQADGIKPDLILLDLMMPIMTGWEFLEALAKELPQVMTPVIVISAVQQTKLPARAQGFLRKPVDLDLLFDTIQKQLL